MSRMNGSNGATHHHCAIGNCGDGYCGNLYWCSVPIGGMVTASRIRCRATSYDMAEGLHRVTTYSSDRGGGGVPGQGGYSEGNPIRDPPSHRCLHARGIMDSPVGSPDIRDGYPESSPEPYGRLVRHSDIWAMVRGLHWIVPVVGCWAE